MSTEDAPQIIERRRVNLPAVDVSSHQWWEAQDNPSLSLRMLIRAEIERNGYTDVANRPVAQQPRRGRPPATEAVIEDDREDAPAAVATAPAVAAPAPIAPVNPIVRESSSPTSGSSLIDSIIGG